MLLLVCGILAGQAGDTLASAADDRAAAGVLGTYECNSGSTAIVNATQPIKVDEYTASNPLLRVTITSAPKAAVLWWDKDKRNWNDDPSTDLKVKQIEANEKYWAVSFEGSFGDRIATAVSGSLSWFAYMKVSGQSDKPILVLTQSSPVFAAASALLCDKL